MSILEVTRLETEDDFERHVAGKDLVMVAFGAPWCPWSRRLEPELQKLRDYIEADPLRYAAEVARVDCTVEASQQLCRRARRRHAHMTT